MGSLDGDAPVSRMCVSLYLITYTREHLLITTDSANVRRMVVNTAMLGNLKNPPEPFGAIIRTHFRLKARSIREQLDQWLAQDDGKPTSADGGGYGGSPPKKHEGEDGAGGSQSAFTRDVMELKGMLAVLEKGDTKKVPERMDVDG